MSYIYIYKEKINNSSQEKYIMTQYRKLLNKKYLHIQNLIVNVAYIV